jgi:hypothetical protein
MGVTQGVLSLKRVPLAFPSLIRLDAKGAEGESQAPTSWIQIAKTGEFQSKRYGEFAITRSDLSEMLHNFKNVTPKAPTELPVDYDHLSMDPKKPLDGVAAGWFKDLELREDGDELWGLIAWTPRAAEAIRNGEYKFVSPSFVKNHVHKDGSEIGATLLAAAVTNHPFLEGMSALTLYSFSAMGDIAMAQSQSQPRRKRLLHLAEVDQRVTFNPDAELTPELTPKERQGVYVIKAIVGEGEDQFVRLQTPDGTEFYGWYRVNQLAPSPPPTDARPHATEDEGANPSLVTTPAPPRPEEMQMSDQMTPDVQLMNLARQHAQPGESLGRAAARVAIEYRDVLNRYVEWAATAVEVKPEPQHLRRDPAPVDGPAAKATRELIALATTIAKERGVDFTTATKLAGQQRADLSATWGRGE